MLDDASRVLRIAYALNRVWQPTHKRLAARAASLAVKPARLAERIEEAFSESDPRRALLVLTELQSETVARRVSVDAGLSAEKTDAAGL